jgi:response regulator NasT
MEMIVVAFENDNNRKRVTEMLEYSGLTVAAGCRSGSEAIRAIRKAGGGIVVCGFKLSEMTVTDLAYDLSGTAMVLAIASPPQLEMCRNDSIFKLPTPFTRGDLISSVRMLLQMQEKNYKTQQSRRSDKDTADINRAKELLMSRNGMTEEEAHRFIQRRSMDTGSKAADTARLIINTYG